jgi:hypothetical protein
VVPQAVLFGVARQVVMFLPSLLVVS